jgi:hypothetical protein
VSSAGIEFLFIKISVEIKRYQDTRSRGAHLAKVHTLDTLATQRRTDWGTGAGLTSADNQLDELVLLQRVSGHNEECGMEGWEGEGSRGKHRNRRTKSEAAEDGQIFLARPLIGSGAKRNG